VACTVKNSSTAQTSPCHLKYDLSRRSPSFPENHRLHAELLIAAIREIAALATLEASATHDNTPRVPGRVAVRQGEQTNSQRHVGDEAHHRATGALSCTKKWVLASIVPPHHASMHTTTLRFEVIILWAYSLFMH